MCLHPITVSRIIVNVSRLLAWPESRVMSPVCWLLALTPAVPHCGLGHPCKTINTPGACALLGQEAFMLEPISCSCVPTGLTQEVCAKCRVLLFPCLTPFPGLSHFALRLAVQHVCLWLSRASLRPLNLCVPRHHPAPGRGC